MRIIAGRYKGVPLSSPKGDLVRPTEDMVKEAIFAKLYDVCDYIVLDLFCGSGALGIEALSRGAKEVIFVDKAPSSCKLTKENLKKIRTNCKVFNTDFKTAISKVNQKFDLIFIDPPYRAGLYDDALKLIYEHDILADDGIIVLEKHKDVNVYAKDYELLSEKKYGTVVVMYLKKKA